MDDPTEEPATDDRFPVRPEGHLQNLPLPMRWEAVRRHPFYATSWRAAQAYYLGEFDSSDPLPSEAAEALRAIGVVGEPPDPATEFAALEDPNFTIPYLGGSLQPLSLRQMAALLVRHLPPAELAYLRAVFDVAADREYEVEGDADGALQRQKAVAELNRRPSPALDSSLDAPLYYLHLGASQRSAVRDLEDLIRRWKHRRGIPETRVRTDKFDVYLAAWDLREGWTRGRYDPSAELKLEAVAGRLHVNISTAFNEYREAFRLITGYEFSPLRWFQLMGPLKAALRADTGGNASPMSPRRWSRPASRHTVPNSVVGRDFGEDRTGGVVGRGAIHLDDIELVDLRIDAKDLFRAGRSDAEVARVLEVSEAAVAYLRERFDEFDTI